MTESSIGHFLPALLAESLAAKPDKIHNSRWVSKTCGILTLVNTALDLVPGKFSV